MRLSFIFPHYLWLLLLLIPLIALAWLGRRRFNPARFWAGLISRVFLFIALIVSIAGIQLYLNSNLMTTVFVLDASDSISAEQHAYGEQIIRETVNQMKKDDRAAVILFGEQALLERLSSEDTNLAEFTSIPITSRTDIANALQLAQAIFPGEGAKRIVLLSDGRENLGKAIEQAELAAASDIELLFFPLGSELTDVEVWVEILDAPAEVRQGQQFDLTVDIRSNANVEAALRVFEDGALIHSRELSLVPGSNRLQIPVNEKKPSTSDSSPGGFRKYRLQIIPDADTRMQNNEASAFTIVHGPPNVLIVEGKPGEADNLIAALESTQVRLLRVLPGAMPTTLSELVNYESIVLVDVPALELPPGVIEILPVFVRDLGRGLVMVGGPQSFGAGGYLRTPLEEALPVNMEIRDKDVQANLALVMAVDKSGSMGRCHCDNPDLNQTYTPAESGQPKVDIAKEAIMRAAAAVGSQDYLGVLAFDSQPRWVLELEKLVDPASLESSISSFQAEGQTNIQAGVSAAYQALRAVEAGRKHIILLTDGWVQQGDLTTMASAMKDEGITLSVVAAGEGSATYLDQIARLGGGEYYPAASIQNVPDIFLKETIKSVGKYTIEEPFFPIPASPSVVLRGLDPASMPPLLGYNGASAKKTARLDLITPRGDPLLATWQYGLGRSAAWTSDLKGQWARDWMNWDNFPRFASQLVSWTLPAPHIEGLSASVHHSDNQAVIEVEAVHKDGSPYNFLTGSVVIVDPDMKTKEIPLKQSGPGLYQVSASASTPGIYLIRVGINDKDRSLGQITLGSVIPYSPEYKSTGLDRSLLNQIASITGGGELSVNDLSAAFTRDLPSVENAREIWWPIMVLVAVLFPLDVALRRLIVRKKDFMLVADRLRASLRGIKSQSSARSSQPQILNRLFEARARARTHARTGSPHAQQSSILNSHPEIEKPKHGSAEHPDADNFADLNEPAAKSNTDDHQSDEDVMSRLRQAKKRARR